MPVVRMPDGLNVRFDDNMSDEQIRNIILTKFPDINKQIDVSKFSAKNVMNDQGLNSSPMEKLDYMWVLSSMIPDSFPMKKQVDLALMAGRTIKNTDFKNMGSEAVKSIGRQSTDLLVGGTGFYAKMAGTMLKDKDFDETDESFVAKARNNTANTLINFGEMLEKYSDKINNSDLLKPEEGLYEGSFEENPNLNKVIDWTMSGVSSLVGMGALSLAVNPIASVLLFSGVDAKDVFEGAIEKGESKSKAFGLWAAGTAGTAVLEKTGAEKVFGMKITKNGFKKIVDSAKSTSRKVVEGMLSEGTTEGLQTVYQNAVTKYGYDDTKDLMENVVESFIGGFGGAGIVSSMNFGYQAFKNKAEKIGMPQEEQNKIMNAIAENITGNPNILEAPLQENMKKTYDSFEKMIEQMGDTAEAARLRETKKALDEGYQKYFEQLKEYMPEEQAKGNAALIRSAALFFSDLDGISVKDWFEQKAPQIMRMNGDENNQKFFQDDIDPISEETIRQFSNEAKKLFNDIKEGKRKDKTIGFGKVKNWLANVSRRFNLNIDGFKHIVDLGGFVHIDDRHGNETRLGQTNVTDEDVALIPEIVSQPNYLVYGVKSGRGLKTIGYIKQFENGATYYVEEVWGRNKELAAKTMYKKEGGKAADEFISSLIHTSETTPSTATIVPVMPINITPSEANVKKNQQTFYQEDLPVKAATRDDSVIEEQKKKNLEYNKAAKDYFGTTYKISEAGYILTDGSMLDLSGKKFGGPSNTRTVDHREISDALENWKAGMEEFINSGNIRFMPEDNKFLLSNLPTPKQFKIIESIINQADGNVTVELMGDANKWGMNRNDFYRDYEDASFNDIKRDISAFFNGQGVREITGFYQGENNPLGAYSNRIIYLNKTANASTLPHELAHFWSDELRQSKSLRAKEILKQADKWQESEFERKYSIKEQEGKYIVTDKAGQTVYDKMGEGFETADKAKAYAKEELFARGFEQYIREGKAPNQTLRVVFRNFFNWLKKIYHDMMALDIKLSNPMRNLYAEILGGTKIDTFLSQDAEQFIEARKEAGQERVQQVQEIIDQAINTPKKTAWQRTKQAYQDFDFSKTWTSIAVPLSTRAKRIAPTFRNMLRRYQFDLLNERRKNYEELAPMLKKWKEFSPEDSIAFDLALKNNTPEIINKILNKYGAEQDFQKVRNILEKIYNEAGDAGMDLSYIEDYFPRKVKDVEGLLAYLQGTDEWSSFEEARRKEDPNNHFSAEEQAEFIDKFLRGIVRADPTSYKYGSEKTRKLDTIDNGINQFYEGSMQALINYVDGMTSRIAVMKFFGRNDKYIDDSIGAFIGYMLDTNQIKASQVDEVKKILDAVFKSRGVSTKWIKGARDIAYLYTMGGVNTAITQIDDIFVSMYKSGVLNTIQSLKEGSKITKRDIGLDSIAAEFMDGTGTAKAVNWVFKKNGIDFIDGIGKNALLNGVLKKAQNMSDEELTGYLTPIMEERTEQTLQDIRNGELSDDVRFFLFNELSDMQPISLLEMPETYNTGGDRRIFYMLKSFMLKRIDTLRNECFDKLKSDDKAERVEGLRNLYKLTLLMMFGGATKDLLIDFMYGRVVDLKDTVVNNLLGMVGISKYNIYQVREEGLGHTLAIFAMPPLFQVAEDLSRDVNKMIDGKRELKDFEVFKGLPIIGRFYYWWLGGGKTKQEKKKAKEKTKLNLKKSVF